MAGKKDPGKFTIKFNTMDPAHRKVIDFLDSLGRTKAQFIANAVLHYLNCSETPDIPQSAPTDYIAVETIVRRILEERLNSEEYPIKPKSIPTENIKKIGKSEDIRFEDAEAFLGDEGMAAIADTLSAFRSKK